MKTREELVKELHDIQALERNIHEEINKLDEDKLNEKLSKYLGKSFVDRNGNFKRCERIENRDLVGTEIYAYENKIYTIHFNRGLYYSYFEEEGLIEVDNSVFNELLETAKNNIIIK